MANLKNDMGLTANDILKRGPKDFKTLEIRVMLMEYYSGIKTKDENNGIHTHAHSSPPVARPRPQSPKNKKDKKKRNRLMRVLKRIGGWFKHKGDWIEEMRGNLSVVSIFIATVTFQALVNPPGGFIQQGIIEGSSLNCTTIYNNEEYCPGEAVSSYNFVHGFLPYVICNTISFISSLSVTLLLVSGIPMKNKVLIWLLSIGMCIALTTLALAYVFAFLLLTPIHLLSNNNVLITLGMSFLAWVGLLVLIMLSITLRLIIWMVKKCLKRSISKLFTCGSGES